MTRETFTATTTGIEPSFGRDVDAATPIGTAKTDATAAEAAVDTVVTDIAAAFTSYNTAAAAIIAITNDHYSNTTHQFTLDGDTGLSHAQWATVGALLNTAAGLANTSKTAADTADVASELVVTDLAATPAVSADVVISFNVANVTKNKLLTTVRGLLNMILGQGIL